MVQKMMEEMTLSGLTSFGGVSEEQLNGILTALNNLIREIVYEFL